MAAGCGPSTPATLALGAQAPDFALKGVDDQTHTLASYAAKPVLAIVFTCNSCPDAQVYESRLQKLHDAYASKGVAVVAVNPNAPSRMALEDLAHSDVGESLDDMKERTSSHQLTYAYLADDSQILAQQYGVVTTPQVFVFDQSRTLRYKGRVDDSAVEAAVTTPDAARAIDALLAGRPVPVAETKTAGCAVRAAAAPAHKDEKQAALDAAPVALQMVGVDELKALRMNPSGKLQMVNFWATWCAPCVSEFPDLVRTYQLYKDRGLAFTAVSVNDPEGRDDVLKFLKDKRASQTNYQFGTADVYTLQEAFDPNLPAPVPFTLLLAPGGDVVYQELGAANVPRLRRAILANLPNDPKYPSLQAYWNGYRNP
jgi:peroxiredoxin